MAEDYKDYYAILGVPRAATEIQIRKAFRRLARLYHPDVARHQRHAEDKFKEINEAYMVLGHRENRRDYDALGVQWHARVPEHAATHHTQSHSAQSHGTKKEPSKFRFEGTGFSHFFHSMLDTLHAPWHHKNKLARAWFHVSGQSAKRGQDIETHLLVTLEEVLHGSTRTITVQRLNEKGKTTRTFTYDIPIPASVRNNQRIRLSGQGELSTHGGPPGDLVLHVHFASHPEFLVEKSDLIYELELAPWEIVLGCTVPIPTLEGDAQLTIPPHTTPGTRLRLRGMGLPLGTARGDLYAQVSVVFPQKITAHEQELWKKLAQESTTNPRRDKQTAEDAGDRV